ncbi:MAG TPA: hypothetical protein VNI83_12870 [Vicinamibacterales bacterium]|nr:hypothetical protein [Vicinamibacterales bacterium]
MATVEERLAFLEGRVDEHARGIEGVREAAVRFDQRMDQLEQRMDRRFEAVERRLEILDAQMHRQFLWLVGLHVTSLLAMVGACAAIVAAILRQ